MNIGFAQYKLTLGFPPAAKKGVILANTPSKDTAAIIFYLTDQWYRLIVLKTGKNLLKNNNPFDSSFAFCNSCKSVFDKKFFKTMNSLNSENPNDTCLGKLVVNNDGSTSRSANEILFDLSGGQPETIKLLRGKRKRDVFFYTPRLASKDCANVNPQRQVFISISDTLRQTF